MVVGNRIIIMKHDFFYQVETYYTLKEAKMTFTGRGIKEGWYLNATLDTEEEAISVCKRFVRDGFRSRYYLESSKYVYFDHNNMDVVSKNWRDR